MISLVSSVVIDSGDSIVLDLGQDTETEPPTPRSQDSASSLLSQLPSKLCLVYSLKDAAADVLSDKTIQEMRKVCLRTAPQSHEARLYELNIVIRAY